MPAGVAAQAVERRLRGQSPLLGENAFGMFDEDPGVERGLELFGARPDKDWSLTDCISFAVMRERELTEALTADGNFTQAGFVALLTS